MSAPVPAAEDQHFSASERAAIARAVTKIGAGAAAQRAERRFEDDPAAFQALLRTAAERP
jgi:hypothetical protein